MPGRDQRTALWHLIPWFDIDEVGGVQVIVRELLKAGLAEWRCADLHGLETLAQRQVNRLWGQNPRMVR